MRIAGFDKNSGPRLLPEPDRRPVRRQRHPRMVRGRPMADWKPNDKFALGAPSTEAWNGRGDAGSRVGFYNVFLDETVSDGRGQRLWGLVASSSTRTFGYAAAQRQSQLPMRRWLAHNAANPLDPRGGCVHDHAPWVWGRSFPGNDPIPTSVTLINPGILNNPSITRPTTLRRRTRGTSNSTTTDDFNYIATYHASKLRYQVQRRLPGL